jgi:hypothetical protein
VVAQRTLAAINSATYTTASQVQRLGFREVDGGVRAPIAFLAQWISADTWISSILRVLFSD